MERLTPTRQLEETARTLAYRVQNEFGIERTPAQVYEGLIAMTRHGGKRNVSLAIGYGQALLRGELQMVHLLIELAPLLDVEG
jgi:hypothetical protein